MSEQTEPKTGTYCVEWTVTLLCSAEIEIDDEVVAGTSSIEEAAKNAILLYDVSDDFDTEKSVYEVSNVFVSDATGGTQ